MCGPPGCGKSTFAEQHLREKPIVSRDAIRFNMVREDEEYFSKEDKVFNTFITSIVGACQSFGCAVVDATHINVGSRRKLFRALDAYIKGRYDTTFIVFNTPLKTCLHRNAKREGRALVPEEALYSMHNHFLRPNYNEHDSIVDIWEIGGRLF